MGSRPEQELHLDRCIDDEVPVLRRRGGGCAVVLDPGNLLVSACLHAPGFGDNPGHFRRLSEWLIQGMGRAGVAGLRQEGISDLALGDRKVCGASLHRSRDTLYYSASLLVQPDIALVERYLKVPPREPDYRRGRSHADFMGSLVARPKPADSEELFTRLRRILKAENIPPA
jgi:lipoate-protein ligase A